jgi:CBS domain-containing protein
MAGQVADLLAAAGLKSDEHGVTASGRVMTHPLAEWHETIAGWLADPTDEALMAMSVLLDARGARGEELAKGVIAAVWDARRRRGLLRLLLRLALANKPPTGFLRNLVVEHSGEHRGRLDIKRGGLLPIVGIARYAGLAAEGKSTSTVSRLKAAGAAGVLPESEATTLVEAWRLMTELRLEHQVRELEAGVAPDDYVDPTALDALTRSHLREAFRLVAVIQRRLATELAWHR